MVAAAAEGRPEEFCVNLGHRGVQEANMNPTDRPKQPVITKSCASQIEGCDAQDFRSCDDVDGRLLYPPPFFSRPTGSGFSTVEQVTPGAISKILFLVPCCRP